MYLLHQLGRNNPRQANSIKLQTKASHRQSAGNAIEWSHLLPKEQRPPASKANLRLEPLQLHPQTLIKAGEAEYIERLIQAVHVGALTEEQHMISDTEFYGMLLDG